MEDVSGDTAGSGDGEASAYVRELLSLGFPPDVVTEAEAARKAGLFAMEPTPDMIERTKSACAAVIDGLRDPPRTPDRGQGEDVLNRRLPSDLARRRPRA